MTDANTEVRNLQVGMTLDTLDDFARCPIGTVIQYRDYDHMRYTRVEDGWQTRHGDIWPPDYDGWQLGVNRIVSLPEEQQPESVPFTPGRFFVACSESSGRRVWFYPVAPMRDGRFYGVNLGTNSLTFTPDGEDIRWDTAALDSRWGSGDGRPLSDLSEDMRDRLTTFLRVVGISVPGEPAGPSVDGSGPDLDAVREEARREERARLEAQFEAWKEHANNVAIEYAHNNGLCSEFERCMEEIGFRGRETDYVVTVSVRVPITARDSDQAWEMVSDTLNYGDGLRGLSAYGATWDLSDVESA